MPADLYSGVGRVQGRVPPMCSPAAAKLSRLFIIEKFETAELCSRLVQTPPLSPSSHQNSSNKRLQRSAVNFEGDTRDGGGRGEGRLSKSKPNGWRARRDGRGRRAAAVGRPAAGHRGCLVSLTLRCFSSPTLSFHLTGLQSNKVEPPCRIQVFILIGVNN